LDELQEIDEEAARHEQEKLERMRIKERATQRHRNKGNWAKGQLKRAMATEVIFSLSSFGYTHADSPTHLPSLLSQSLSKRLANS